jgi:hypothetical protein
LCAVVLVGAADAVLDVTEVALTDLKVGGDDVVDEKACLALAAQTVVGALKAGVCA